MDQSGSAARARTRTIPDGVYEGESYMGDDGVEIGKPILLATSARTAVRAHRPNKLPWRMTTWLVRRATNRSCAVDALCALVVAAPVRRDDRAELMRTGLGA
jgi:hypothetical protein